MLSMFIDTAVGTRVTMHTTRIKEVRAELIRFAEENARLLSIQIGMHRDICANALRAEEAEARVQELERENAILEIKNRGTLANNLCPDHRDKQTGKPCLACTIEKLQRENGELLAMRDGWRTVTYQGKDCVAAARVEIDALRERAERAESKLAAVEKRIAEAPRGIVCLDEREVPSISCDFDEGTHIALLPLDDETKS